MPSENKLTPSDFEAKWPRKTPTELRGKQSYKPGLFETKWQEYWEQMGVYQPDFTKAKRPFYNLMMFPYPSAEGLHVGNMYAFTGADIYGRYKRMQGYDVFEPIGLDGFGIHSENYAIKVGKNPAEQALISEKNFYRQLHAIGNGFAWKNKLETYDPEYYRFTQWIFVQMFKHGLAYRKKSPVNFCPSCKTVLSDEQVIDGLCERCKSAVEKRQMEQWFFRITSYAEKLLQNTYKDSFQWTNKVKVGQRNWIGKKEGINITYDIDGTSEKITVFTTAPVNFGMTFLVLAPEHELVPKIIDGSMIVTEKSRNEVKEYCENAKKKKEYERIAEGREKTGVFTGLYAINSINGKKVPIWITDFVLGHVGTGAVQGCPGHDKKDFQFAKKFGLPIIRVIAGPDGDTSPIDRVEQVIEKGMKGHFANSEFLNGLDFEKGLQKTMDYFEEKGCGKRVIEYKLRDWCISRQRYWGAPIPMVYCQNCAKNTSDGGRQSRLNRERHDSSEVKGSDLMPGWFPVPEDQLPVLLPENVKDWKPEGTGKGPLAKIESFVNVACPECGKQARRETDVCDTFLDSSWYHLRYPSIKSKETMKQLNNDTKKDKLEHWNIGTSEHSLPWDPSITRKWLPVTQYIGGAEHTVLHLLYARFIAMALKDFGYIDFEEPYTRFYAHGLIIAEGAKMSKSKGNVIVPDEYIKAYGADTLRTYLMFLGPFDAGGDFRDTGIAGMYRFLNRVWKLASEVILTLSETKGKNPVGNSENGGDPSTSSRLNQDSAQDDALTRVMHRTIKEVTEDLENLRYNTAISHIMIYVNELQNSVIRNQNSVNEKLLTDNLQLITDNHIKTLLLLLAPFAPHMTEELWQRLSVVRNQNSAKKIKSTDNRLQNSEFYSIHLHPWPLYDPKFLVEDEVTIVVQVNGKTRDDFQIQNSKSKIQKEVEEFAKKSEKIQKYISGLSIRKVVFIPGKLINFVV